MISETLFPAAPAPDLAANGQAEVAAGSNRSWHKSAPRSVRRARNAAEAWRAWSDHLTNRRRPRNFFRTWRRATQSPLLWAVPTEGKGDETESLVTRLFNISTGGRPGEEAAQELKYWLDEFEHPKHLRGDNRLRFALEALAWSAALPSLTSAVPNDVWWQALEGLIAAAQPIGRDADGGQALTEQLLCGELALTLAWQFPELNACRQLAASAHETLSFGLNQVLTADALPRGCDFARLRPLAACWTRCRRIMQEFPAGHWGKAAEDQYRRLVRQLLRYTRPDGRQFLVSGRAGAWCPELFAAAVQLGGGKAEERIAAVALPFEQAGKQRRKPADGGGLKRPANHAEASATAVLRTGWTADAESLALNYDGDTIQAALVAGDDPLLAGLWSCELRADGRPLRRLGTWESLCWVSDSDADYLELELKLEDDVRVQRQIMLARRDRFLYSADCIIGAEPRAYEYAAHWQLAMGAVFTAERDTRECYLTAGDRQATLVPLAQPEWRQVHFPGAVTLADEEGLEIRQAATAERFYAPWFVDLDPRRQGKELTWRQLTVAEDRRILSADTAVAYRMQVGKKQWFIYRSLTPPPPSRTALGQNVNTEFVVGRFLKDGNVAHLVNIE